MQLEDRRRAAQSKICPYSQHIPDHDQRSGSRLEHYANSAGELVIDDRVVCQIEDMVLRAVKIASAQISL